MQAIISKMRLGDSMEGADVEVIRFEVCKSADDYATNMVNILRLRHAGAYPPESAPATQPSAKADEYEEQRQKKIAELIASNENIVAVNGKYPMSAALHSTLASIYKRTIQWGEDSTGKFYGCPNTNRTAHCTNYKDVLQHFFTLADLPVDE